VDGTGVIGYIEIPDINVSLPIYHGVEDMILQIAIGHLPGTSFPIGGESTHCAISGHRGLPSAKLFTNLDQLKEGDLFMMRVLDESYTYEVDQIRIVEPEDMSALGIERDEDYMTLVTCTPYGVNTHRLLVRGHRTDGNSGKKAIPAEAVQIPNYIAVPAVGIPMLFTYLAVTLVADRGSRRHHKVDREKALEELRGGGARGGDKT
jgi:sortase A